MRSGQDRDKAQMEIVQGQRFAFGRNWAKWLETLGDESIRQSERCLKETLRVDLKGKSFVDVGSGIGIHSLAAMRAGVARLLSFDVDIDSVSCTESVKTRFYPDVSTWKVCHGSILDKEFVESIGQFDVVYSWGVLHHSGQMWKGLGNAIDLVKGGGILFVAIYNDQGWRSRWWRVIKRLYNHLPSWLRWVVVGPSFVCLWGPTLVRDLVRLTPLRTWKQNVRNRGASPWRDVIDWVGGYPFEVATPEVVFHFVTRRGFVLVNLKTCLGGHGCNEFVFHRLSA